MPDREHVPRAVPDLINEQVERLKQLFPESFSEGRLDCEKLKATIGEIVDDSPERYSFTWAGKREAIELLQRPSWAALAPDREESVNFDDTNNIFIEGENLEVLKLLYRAYFGRVKMIYIDPPYNTGNDFVYPDNFADPMETYLRLTGQRDEEGNLLTTNPETGGRYHSAWLSMMYPRLFLARQLLRDDGVIFVSIDDHEVHNLRMLMNEVFGEENFLATFCRRRRMSTGLRGEPVSPDHEYVVAYGRSKPRVILYGLLKDASSYQFEDERGWFTSTDLTIGATKEQRPNQYYAIANPSTGAVYSASEDRVWRFEKTTMEGHIEADRIIWPDDPPPDHRLNSNYDPQGRTVPRFKTYYDPDDDAARRPVSTWMQKSSGDTEENVVTLLSDRNEAATRELIDLFGEKVMDYPKPVSLLTSLISLATAPGDIVMDFFAGSATTAHAVVERSRNDDDGGQQFIMVQLPEPLTPPETLSDGTELPTISAIGRERIRRVFNAMSERSGVAEQTPMGSPDDEEVDLGFRAFRLQESNLRRWPDEVPADTAVVPEHLQQQMDPLREGWSEEAVIAEVALKEGFGLNYRLNEVEGIESNTVYRVVEPDKEQTLFICLDETLHDETWQGLSLEQEDLFICRDVALDDTQAANLALQCRLHTI